MVLECVVRTLCMNRINVLHTYVYTPYASMYVYMTLCRVKIIMFPSNQSFISKINVDNNGDVSGVGQ